MFGALTPEDPERVGPYRIVARLGAGGMGRVYLGRSRGGRPVAVKVVRPELAGDEDFRRRFAREVTAARQVNGVYTAGVVDADPDGDPAWLATAYVRGVSLDAAVAAHGPLPEPAVLALGAGLAEALEAIHTAGVVHRDLKPSNVLLAADGPRVIDFGISVVAETSALTRAGTLIGTPGFMSPEQLRGRPVHTAGDVFSLGAVLVFAATGVGPFGVGSTHGVLFRTVYEPPDTAALPPGRLLELATWCLAKDPAERPTVPALTDEFAQALGDPQELAEVLAGGAWLPRAVAHTLAGTPVPPAAGAPGGRNPGGTSGATGPVRETRPSGPPDVPETPATTETSVPPVAPATPATPASPVTPASPDTSASPATPATPAIPEAAEPPGAPPRPGAPGGAVPAARAEGPEVPEGPAGGLPPAAAGPGQTGPTPAPAPPEPPPAEDGARPTAYGPAPPPYHPGPATGPVGRTVPAARPAGATGEPPPVRRPARRRALLAVTAVVTVAAVAAAIVWSNRGGGGAEGRGDTRTTAPTDAPTEDRRPVRTRTVTIGVSAPLTGDLAPFGQGIRNAVDLAVRNANSRKEVSGITFEVSALDDRADPAQGVQNASRLVGDDQVLGVVGPVNASVAQSTQQVFGAADLAEVSPATTNPVLTLGAGWVQGARARPSDAFFRTVTTDAQQGTYAAQYLYREAEKRKAFVIDDQSAYGTALADSFGDGFTALGGKVVRRHHVAAGSQDFARVVSDVRDSGADVVYFGGAYPDAGPLSKQLKEAGFDQPLAGGDGLYSEAFADLAGGSRADGDLCTTVGVPVAELDTARAFVADYQRAGFAEEPGQYGGYAYDAAWAIVQAVKAVADDHGGALPDDARAEVVKALHKVSFTGVTGEVAFDEYGDTTNRRLSVNRVDDGAWRYVTSGTPRGGRPAA
ncbi:ABC transporter substrate-binding protein [Streptomyces sp. NPDC018031]|uniref:bifunctional serine/threonine-protein kinase/ABC transporter substrate-binding protein n=1 Tax=Streptomyces sp. NPDC018031 TaxID=3365033 RepID=UPI0037A77490